MRDLDWQDVLMQAAAFIAVVLVITLALVAGHAEATSCSGLDPVMQAACTR